MPASLSNGQHPSLFHNLAEQNIAIMRCVQETILISCVSRAMLKIMMTSVDFNELLGLADGITVATIRYACGM